VVFQFRLKKSLGLGHKHFPAKEKKQPKNNIELHLSQLNMPITTTLIEAPKMSLNSLKL